MNIIVYLFLSIILFGGCSSGSTTEKYQNKRDHIVYVNDQIKEIVIEDVLVSNYVWIRIVNKYICIIDYKSANELIHIFNKDDFKYITSTGLKGQGPGEIARIGHIAEDKVNRKFYVSDHAKYKIFSFDMDSAIADPAYLPIEKIKMSELLFPGNYVYINDTLSIGIVTKPIGTNDFMPIVGKINMITGEIIPMNYTIAPGVKKKRVSFDISIEYGIYVECYMPHDLMTICSIDGKLKYNIYGPNWDTETHGKDYYGPVVFCKDRIVVLYSGEKSFTKDRKSNLPTKFLVFDLEGNYLRTLETGYKIANICYDKDNNRILMNMDDDKQLAYLDLNGLLD